MPACTWPRGCAQTALGADLCTYHEKVATGFIVSTRSTEAPGSQDVIPISLSPADAAKAQDAQDRYVHDVLAPMWRRMSAR